MTARVNELLGVGDGLHTLDDDLPVPHAADDVEILVADRGVHGGVEEFTDRAARRVEGSELKLGGREEVKPPPGPR